MVDIGLTGRGLMQSTEEWATRNEVLARTLSDHINRHLRINTGRALDVGCQTGRVTDRIAALTPLHWTGIEPSLAGEGRSPGGLPLQHGWSNAIPFPDEHFDCVLLANVYEHIDPQQYTASLIEMRRVLAPGGILVGQVPNPYSVIESHSRLPFMGWLPYRAQKAYWKLSPSPWPHDFYVVTARDITRRATPLGLAPITVENFVYPLEVIPQSVRWAAQLLHKPMLRFMPWAWQFVLKKV